MIDIYPYIVTDGYQKDVGYCHLCLLSYSIVIGCLSESEGCWIS